MIFLWGLVRQIAIRMMKRSLISILTLLLGVGIGIVAYKPLEHFIQDRKIASFSDSYSSEDAAISDMVSLAETARGYQALLNTATNNSVSELHPDQREMAVRVIYNSIYFQSTLPSIAVAAGYDPSDEVREVAVAALGEKLNIVVLQALIQVLDTLDREDSVDLLEKKAVILSKYSKYEKEEIISFVSEGKVALIDQDIRSRFGGTL